MATVLTRECDSCGEIIPLERITCATCGKHCDPPPNVYLASLAEEVAALKSRYDSATAAAQAGGSEPQLKSFEKAIEETSKAVVHTTFSEAFRLASDEKNIYSTYYKRIEGETRLPDDNAWHQFRKLADSVFFNGYERDIRFACISLTGVALPNYGDAALTLRSDRIENRSSVFEDNTVIFLRKLNPSFENLPTVPDGHRATWKSRGTLAACKHQGEIAPSTKEEVYASILVKKGADSSLDEFIEVHIFGSFTVNTLEEIVLVQEPESAAKKLRLQEFLDAKGVALREEITPEST